MICTLVRGETPAPVPQGDTQALDLVPIQSGAVLTPARFTLQTFAGIPCRLGCDGLGLVTDVAVPAKAPSVDSVLRAELHLCWYR